ncbi:MAG TPA: hypothetical protein VMV73_04275 [Candidatus Dormibacteraeota bacterium]|nr:hypothetical protein [Candidatus Dormibacteraeota bacterium]
MLGGNSSTLAFTNSLIPDPSTILARLVPVAVTPIDTALGDTWQSVGIAPEDLLAWIDRTFSAEDESAWVAPLRDLDLLARVGWSAPLPVNLSQAEIINIEDLPPEIVEALESGPVPIVACALCRRLCVRDDFLWGERQLCAWDFHHQVFGRRGPWRNGAYEEHHYETLPRCGFVAPSLIEELGVEILASFYDCDERLVRSIIAQMLDADKERSHIAVKVDAGFVVLRERV